jgi:hypothetical protein
MTIAKRQFLKDCARYISGEINEIKLSGSEKTIGLFAHTLRESRALFVALQTKKNISDVIPVLESKKRAAKLLQKRTGFTWPF